MFLPTPFMKLKCNHTECSHWAWTAWPCVNVPVGAEVTWYRSACAATELNACVFAELQDAVAEVMPTLKEQGISVYVLSEACGIQGVNTLSEEISKASDEPLSRELRASVHIRSTALYIYTSGTTGMWGNSHSNIHSYRRYLWYHLASVVWYWPALWRYSDLF